MDGKDVTIGKDVLLRPLHPRARPVPHRLRRVKRMDKEAPESRRGASRAEAREEAREVQCGVRRAARALC